MPNLHFLPLNTLCKQRSLLSCLSVVELHQSEKGKQPLQNGEQMQFLASEWLQFQAQSAMPTHRTCIRISAFVGV